MKATPVVNTNFYDPRREPVRTRPARATLIAASWRISRGKVIVCTKLPAVPAVGPADWTDPNAVQSALLPVGVTSAAGSAETSQRPGRGT